LSASIDKRFHIGLLSPEESKVIEMQLDVENAERERIQKAGMRTRKRKDNHSEDEENEPVRKLQKKMTHEEKRLEAEANAQSLYHRSGVA